MALLSQAEFLEKRPEGNYARYKRWVKKTRARRAEKVRSYDPTSPGPMPGYVTNAYNQEARGMIGAQINPLIRELTRASQARSTAGQSAITGYTKELAGQLAGVPGQVGEAYSQAQSGQAAADAALSKMLAGQGGGLADELARKLGAAGQETASAGAARDIGAGAAGTSYAQGSATLGQLLAQGAAAKGYAAKLPGIAALGGLQSSKQLQAQSAASLAEQLGSVRSQVPGLISQTLSDLQNRELQKYITRKGFAQDAAAFGEEQRQFDTGIAMDIAGAQADQAQGTAEDRKANKKERTQAFYSARSEAFAEAKRLAAETVSTGAAAGGLVPGSAGSEKPRYTPKQIYAKLYKQFAPELLRRYGFSKARVRQMIANASGYRPTPSTAGNAGTSAPAAFGPGGGIST